MEFLKAITNDWIRCSHYGFTIFQYNTETRDQSYIIKFFIVSVRMLVSRLTIGLFCSLFKSDMLGVQKSWHSSRPLLRVAHLTTSIEHGEAFLLTLAGIEPGKSRLWIVYLRYILPGKIVNQSKLDSLEKLFCNLPLSCDYIRPIRQKYISSNSGRHFLQWHWL